MTVAVRLIIVLSIAVVAVSSAGILETLLSTFELPETEARSSTSQSKCLCQTSGCLCCVDLNLTTTIDLGGPACINMKQKEQNVSLNLSYGDNPVHNATIRIDKAANRPTCMNLLSDLAQLCAKFTSISRSSEQGGGYDGCLVIEPALMTTPQATYQMGCFNFNQGVRQIEKVAKESPVAAAAAAAAEEEDSDEEEGGINTDELIAAVSASAEQGIALFSQWLGLNLNPQKLNATWNKSQQETSQTSQASQTSQPSSRMARQMSQERFKQLLSAQDNIVRESARIGHSEDGARTTFVYSPMDSASRSLNQDPSSSSSSSVVLRESQRGGRAYNIHQHVNEV